ncbi:hypothetical protein [Nocardia colli]|uniref:hypothetical protein n=1 Tax=Nocardia colli TaxID=2545717 RepID=UPI0035DB3C66
MSLSPARVTALIASGVIAAAGLAGLAPAVANAASDCGAHAEDYYGGWTGKLGRASSDAKGKMTLYPPEKAGEPQRADGEIRSRYGTYKDLTGEFTVKPDAPLEKLEVRITSPKLGDTTRWTFEPKCPGGSTRPNILLYHYDYVRGDKGTEDSTSKWQAE